jgi:hypothetical protein
MSREEETLETVGTNLGTVGTIWIDKMSVSH